MKCAHFTCHSCPPPTSDFCTACDESLSEYCRCCYQKLKEENESLRRAHDNVWAALQMAVKKKDGLIQALEDIREWAKHDDVIRFDDGDMPLSDFCTRALHGGK